MGNLARDTRKIKRKWGPYWPVDFPWLLWAGYSLYLGHRACCSLLISSILYLSLGLLMAICSLATSLVIQPLHGFPTTNYAYMHHHYQTLLKTLRMLCVFLVDIPTLASCLTINILCYPISTSECLSTDPVTCICSVLIADLWATEIRDWFITLISVHCHTQQRALIIISN